MIPEPKPAPYAPARVGAARPVDVDRQGRWNGASTPVLVAILTEDDPKPGAAAPPSVAAGGPTFAGSGPITTPVGPPGVRTLTPNRAPGTIAPAESTRSKTRRARRSRTFVVGLLVLATLGAGGYLAYPRVRAEIAARSVPGDLRAYVKGKGVVYAPAGQGYSVRLPRQPVRRDGLRAGSDARPPMFVHRSIASSGDYQIVIRVGDLPSVTAFPFGIVSALSDPRIAGSNKAVKVHQLDFAGQSAYDYDLRANPPSRGRIFLHGTRLYVITVQSKSVDTVFDAVVSSFRLSK